MEKRLIKTRVNRVDANTVVRAWVKEGTETKRYEQAFTPETQNQLSAWLASLTESKS